MASGDAEVVIVGGGAAGVAAARRLHDSGVPCLLVEARSRLGGRAFTITDRSGHALDVGCGWLHSADRNPWSNIAEAQHRQVDRTPPPWMRPALQIGFPLDEQRAYRDAADAFYARLDDAGDAPDRAAVALLDPGGRWNNLIVAVNTFVTGTELERVSILDLARYDDTGVNWRVVEGFGTTIAAHGAGLPVALDCPVQCIDHSGPRLRIETANGTTTADRAIVTVPTSILATPEFFTPALPGKTEAACGLPLGLDDKLFLSLDEPDEFEQDSRLFGRTLASDLEAGGERAFFDFAVSELVERLGGAFARRVKPIAMHRWGADPFARGSYSYALPGKADLREVLAAPVDDRLFFAGEACSRHDFSTAHGGFFTGVAAADQVIAARRQRRS